MTCRPSSIEHAWHFFVHSPHTNLGRHAAPERRRGRNTVIPYKNDGVTQGPAADDKVFGLSASQIARRVKSISLALANAQ